MYFSINFAFFMKQAIRCLLVLLINSHISYSKIPDTIFQQTNCGIRVSVLTCGAGNDLYSSYGHTALRIFDSCKLTDMVYNYGTFNFSDPQFYSKFVRGKLDYYLNDETYDGFMEIYVDEGRGVHEQILNLNHEEAHQIQLFLLNNLKEENKYYKYDFLFDNCSTRVRDIFDSIFKSNFNYARVITDDSVSFRTVLDYYERNIHWERFGINLLLSHQVDDKMTSRQSMFLPDYLEQGMAKATLNGKAFVQETKILLASNINMANTPNQPRILFWGFVICLFFLSLNKKIAQYFIYFDVLFFLILGLLGCLMLFMWLGTEHKVCAWNRNLLWAFPLHVVFAIWLPLSNFRVPQYAKAALSLLFVTMFYGLFAEQKYIIEISPVLVLIVWRLSTYANPLRQFNLQTFKNFGS
jgi:hypothetical protein